MTLAELTPAQQAKVARLNNPNLAYAIKLVLKRERRMQSSVRTVGSIKQAQPYYHLPVEQE